MHCKAILLDKTLPAPAKADEVKAEDADGKSLGARSSHGCSVFEGSAYVFGGEIIARTPVDSTLWSRNLSEASEWAPVEAKGDAPPHRVAHAQAVVGGFLYIFGGRQGISMEEAPLNDLWKFSFKDRAWTGPINPKQGTPPAARSFHKMLPLGDKLYVYGGCSAKGRLADLHCYDCTTDSWSFLSDPPESMPGRGGAGFVASSDSKSLFVVGGFIGQESNAVYRFELEAKKWEVVLAEGNDKIRPFSVSCGVTLSDVLLFFGGEVDPSTKGHEGAGSFSSDVVILNGLTGLPTSTVKLEASTSPGPQARGWAAADAWGGDKMVLYGGLSGSDKEPTRLADTWVLQLSK
mmetsp:Transcript_4030/g.7750  ORF Transcript_4030/g.7750 Transcript_4030/m.7750 type:complete len:348 (+) Transcript_4030:58-1101(+)|eukprot:CAMPEP_0175092012 /NCGR_PEP_ID=MMETSP0086_2-20121207/2226_1 /TAXON_ID=136419 /ORGANISM="Unknown Unknown, Strain D1" /LENGTH=347 /DNA_ID=CAMNT_0016364827 /DNA_START=58 /DNA_END=1101 /DNA_ORIENTATION=+